ncbi:MAG TPA: PAS domain S-box protein [Gammaproteobacteria bacterium]|nr:PAS domain S-box protein [Gammaproteobacteria bacterium]
MTAPGVGDAAMMANAELHALFDAAVDAIVVIDEQGRILAFNRAAERVFGRSAAEVVGERVEILMPEPDRSRHGAYMRRYIETGEARIIGIGREVNAVRASGEVFPIALSVGEAVSRGQRRFVAIIRDLSGERAAELRARSLESRLAHVDRFNLMGEMAAGIAHEVNQPLSAIATYAQAARRMLQREPMNKDALDDICGKIDAQARRAGQVIENVRKFIRRRDDRTELLDVNRVIEDVRELIEADAHAADIQLAIRFREDLPPVRGDAVQLQQVVLNLSRNAVDAMRGGPSRRRGIVVETGLAPDGKVRVTVTDHGPGVSKSLGQNIFHPFITTKSSGLGVGLAISRTIAQAFGGTLDYADHPEGGAVFSLELPAAGEGETREK